ncbi:MAG: bacteriocin [Salibacteraceae bacterium]
MSEELNENELENVSGGAGVEARREEESFDEGGREEERREGDSGMSDEARLEKFKRENESRD